jgi:type II secretory pathway pseudopilin PulG
MSKLAGYSVVEVLAAVVVVGIGLTAAAVLVGGIMAREEQSLISLRAANLQEQAVTLYRLGLEPGLVVGLMPEVSVEDGEPAPGTFGLLFGVPSTENISIVKQDGGTTIELPVLSNNCTVVFPNPVGESGTTTYSSNTVPILRPVIQ